MPAVWDLKTFYFIMIKDDGRMHVDLKGRDYLTLKDFSKEEIVYLVQLGLDLKKKQKNGVVTDDLKGKSLGMIFEKSSTRTRVSFEVGMYQLGGQALFLSSNDIQIGRGETIEDTARVLSRYLDGIMIRTYSHSDVEQLAKYASIPVINGLTDDYHPTQALADLMTIVEHKGSLEGLHFTYVGDGNNMLHSLMIAAVKMGMHMHVATPKGYEPDSEVVNYCRSLADQSGTELTLSYDADQACQGTDVIYTDTWASMGQENEKAKRAKIFKAYQVDENLMRKAKDDAIFMHCLPAYRGYEVTNEVIESKQSVVFDEAENRLHAHKAIMAAVMV